MNMPCPCRVDCPGTDSPFANLTSEAPDQLIFIGYAWGNELPNLGWNFGDPIDNNPSFCDSPVSQQEADLCANRNHTGCLVGDCGPGDSGPSIPWTDPQRRRIETFLNAAAFCTVFCEDGLPFTYTVKAGIFRAFSQTNADEIAISYACQLANLNSVCFGSITGTCINANYLAVISVTGGFAPYTIAKIGGTLPPGVGFVQDTPTTAFLSGVPTTAGNFTFTVRAVDTKGNFMQKDFTVGVLGFNNPATITPATVGTAYSYQFNPAGGTGPFTVSYVSGVIPAGFTLSSSGLLSGTASTAESDNFTIQVADSTGKVCQQNFTVTVDSALCDASVDWLNNPGNCRLRIKNWNITIFHRCPTCNFTLASPQWDGTFPNHNAPTNYNIDPSIVNIGGGAVPLMSSCNINFNGSDWYLQLACTGGPAAYLWVGRRNGPGPIGTYLQFNPGCNAGVASVDVEGYKI